MKWATDVGTNSTDFVTLIRTNHSRVIRNEKIVIAAGGVPFTDCYLELWVLHDDDFDKAQGLLTQWRDRESQHLEPWICAHCGEENEGQFGACWKCGEMVDEEEQL